MRKTQYFYGIANEKKKIMKNINRSFAYVFFPLMRRYSALSISAWKIFKKFQAFI